MGRAPPVCAAGITGFGQPEMTGLLAVQRCFKRPDDLVGALLFLLGSGLDFITGQDIWVNGGRMFS